MNDFPEFSQHGYQVEKELGHNRAGGRVTYLATEIATGKQVVIKQFQFARAGSNWADFDSYDREIQVLRGLHHDGIPHYLSSFHSDSGFCMVQEFKNANSLAEVRSFSPSDVEQIAISALEILIYLQNRIPPVIHRDVKPENILVDDQLNVYLVDFGFARIGDGEVGMSSVVKGTLGFMPPEQLFNRQLTEASDLYGLGITLICLLTKTKTTEVGNLIDITYRVSFKHLVPKLSLFWTNWLEKMVEPSVKARFSNAKVALEALPDHPMRLPDARLSQSTLEFTVNRPGEVLTQTVTVTNLIPDTLLQGRWQVASHPSDQAHPWITVAPAQFESNHADCEISIHSDRLIPNKLYDRKLLLHANTATQTYTLTLHIRTSPIRLKLRSATMVPLVVLNAFAISTAWLISSIALITGTVALASSGVILGTAAGVAVGCEVAAWMLSVAGASSGANAGVIAGVATGVLTVLIALTQTIALPGAALLAGVAIGFVGGGILGGATGVVVEHFVSRKIKPEAATLISLLTTAFGVSLGLGLTFGFSASVVPVAMAGSGLPLGFLLVYGLMQRVRVFNNNRRSEQHLIRP
ncbi:serine/threonine protein kinase [Phormidesmis sp. 146-12]